ncbi:hypothetical protein SDC9_116243 [bioreactor metagenome]|uniref:Uncharacterized protein n=1 Tax=bioreactor metagenome TaxID=1076179 RepID=A0A645BW15_9ZZZZ
MKDIEDLGSYLRKRSPQHDIIHSQISIMENPRIRTLHNHEGRIIYNSRVNLRNITGIKINLAYADINNKIPRRSEESGSLGIHHIDLSHRGHPSRALNI